MPPPTNLGVARILNEIADLLELKGENPFKIRAYRQGADLVAQASEPVATLSETDLRGWPGIGKDLSARIREICETGASSLHQELSAERPPTLLDLLRLPGVGPKTVALLYEQLRIASLADLEQAALAGRLRTLKGMGARKEQQLLAALAARTTEGRRHLLADATTMASRLIDFLHEQVPGVTCEIAGSVRRGVETCGDLDILATTDAAPGDPLEDTGACRALMEAFVTYPLVERVLARGATRSRVLMQGDYQADLHVAPAGRRGAALQHFTGSAAHTRALADRALERGLRLTEQGLVRTADGAPLGGATEEGLYGALGLAWVPPELREDRGELEAAAARALPVLITERDLRGDLHAHTTASDGKDDLEAMARAACEAGLEYLAITDHSQSLAMANGLDESRLRAQAARIRELDARLDGIHLLAGVECDILPDGRLDLSDDCLAELDLVIASAHSALRQDEATMTLRLRRAIENPWVDIIGHPTNRLLLRREPSSLQLDVVMETAVRHGVALEINSHVNRLDLSDVNARRARRLGVPLVISTDAHSGRALANRRWGVIVARRAGATRADVLNTLPFEEFRQRLRRNRTQGSRHNTKNTK